MTAYRNVTTAGALRSLVGYGMPELLDALNHNNPGAIVQLASELRFQPALCRMQS